MQREEKVNNKRRRSNDEEEEVKKSIKTDDNYWADIYLQENDDSIIITDKKLKGGYMWDKDEKLWKQVDSRDIKKDISQTFGVYFLQKITQLHKELIKLDSVKDGDLKKIKGVKMDIEFYSKNNARYLDDENIKAVFDIICSRANPESESKMNPDPHLFSLVNGLVIDLKTKQVRDRQKTDFITIKTEVNYNPSTKEKGRVNFMERFMLELCCKNVDQVRKFQKIIGKYLTGEPADAVDVWHGKNELGKILLMGIIEKVVRGYTHSCHLGEILSQRVFASQDLISLVHARVAFYGKYDTSDELDSLIIESFTNKEEIVARRPHGSTFSFVPKFKIVMKSDQKPLFYRHSLHSLDEKFLGTRFNDYANHLDEIFEWMVEGAYQYLGDPKSETKKIGETELKRDMEELDIVNRFVTENCTIDEKLSVSEKDFKKRYMDWREINGEYISKDILYSDFKREFEKLYPSKKETTGVKYHGFGLNFYFCFSLSSSREKKLSKEEDFLYKLLHLYVDVKMLRSIDGPLIGRQLERMMEPIRSDNDSFFYYVDSSCYIDISGEEKKLTQELEDYYFSLSLEESADTLAKIVIQYKKEIFSCLLERNLFNYWFDEKELKQKVTQEKMLEICKKLFSIYDDHDHSKWINDHPIFITYYLSRVKEIFDEFFPRNEDLSSLVLKFVSDISDGKEEKGKIEKNKDTIEICRKLFHPEKSIYYSSLLTSDFVLPKDLMKIVISYIPSSSSQEVEEFLLNF
jgi:phage/plasmid-associated DNA primase